MPTLQVIRMAGAGAQVGGSPPVPPPATCTVDIVVSVEESGCDFGNGQPFITYRFDGIIGSGCDYTGLFWVTPDVVLYPAPNPYITYPYVGLDAPEDATFRFGLAELDGDVVAETEVTVTPRADIAAIVEELGCDPD